MGAALGFATIVLGILHTFMYACKVRRSNPPEGSFIDRRNNELTPHPGRTLRRDKAAADRCRNLVFDRKRVRANHDGRGVFKGGAYSGCSASSFREPVSTSHRRDREVVRSHWSTIQRTQWRRARRLIGRVDPRRLVPRKSARVQSHHRNLAGSAKQRRTRQRTSPRDCKAQSPV